MPCGLPDGRRDAYATGMHDDVQRRIRAIEILMSDRLHLTHGRLDGLLRAARGRLPRGVLRQGRELVDAQARLANPATARAVRIERVTATCDLMERALRAVPEGKYRRRYWSARAGVAALNLLAVVGLFALFMWWRGAA